MTIGKSIWNSDEINIVKMSILSTIGIIIYTYVICSIIDTKLIEHDDIRTFADDVLKFGTLFLFMRLLSGESLGDPIWIAEIMYTFLGFFVYDFVILNIIDTHIPKKTNEFSIKARQSFSDAIKFLTMFTITRYISGKEFTTQWLLNVIGFVIGIVTYDLLISDLY